MENFCWGDLFLRLGFSQQVAMLLFAFHFLFLLFIGVHFLKPARWQMQDIRGVWATAGALDFLTGDGIQ